MNKMTLREELFDKAVKFEMADGLFIEKRGKDSWAITNIGNCYAKEGGWEHEPLPSNRSNEFIARTRFTLEEACKITKRLSKEWKCFS